jgi:hypothetical protein
MITLAVTSMDMASMLINGHTRHKLLSAVACDSVMSVLLRLSARSVEPRDGKSFRDTTGNHLTMT